MEIKQALSRDDVPELTKKMIESATLKQCGLQYEDYNGNAKHAPYSLYMASNSSSLE